VLGGILEDRLKIYPGRFRHWPEGGVSRLINEPIASGIVYSAILAAWSFVAMSSMPKQAGVIAIAIGLTSLCLTYLFFRQARKEEMNKAGTWPPQKLQEEKLYRPPWQERETATPTEDQLNKSSAPGGGRAPT
jgi:hypothetical protein